MNDEANVVKAALIHPVLGWTMVGLFALNALFSYLEVGESRANGEAIARMEESLVRLEARMVNIEQENKEQGERLARIEGHLNISP